MSVLHLNVTEPLFCALFGVGIGDTVPYNPITGKATLTLSPTLEPSHDFGITEQL